MEKQQIEQAVRRFFGGSVQRLSVVMIGHLADVELIYQDFLPIPTARAWLNGNIDNLLALELERTYSPQVLASVPDGQNEEEWLFWQSAIKSSKERKKLTILSVS